MDGFEQKNLTEDAELDIFVRTHNIFLMGSLEINDVNHEVVEIYQSRLQLFCFVAVVLKVMDLLSQSPKGEISNLIITNKSKY